MTLIALTLNHGSPIMMADILFSSMHSNGDLAVPTFSKGTAGILKGNSGRKPFSLMQKLYIINDRLCVALGGGHDQMLTFYNRLKAFFPSEGFSEREIEEFINTYPQESKENLIAIVLGCVLDGKKIKFRALFIGDVIVHEDELFQKVFAAGSGKQKFLEHIARRQSFEVSNSPDTPLIINLSMIGYWLGSDYVSPVSLKNHFGAGYELVVFKNNKFIKLDEYVVVILHAEMGEGIEFISHPINTIMMNYQDDDLIIRSFSFDIENPFGIPPIYKDETHFTLLQNNPHYQNLLVVYVVESHYDNKFYCPSFVVTQNENELSKSPIKIERVDSKLRVYTSKLQDKYMHDMLLKTIKASLSK